MSRMVNDRLEGVFLGCRDILRLTIVLFVACFFNSCHAQNRIVNQTQESMKNLQYDVYGQGSSVMVFLHGLGSNKKAWSKIIPYLKKDYKIYAIDFPKYLDSDNKSEVGISNYAKLLNNFIHSISQDRVHVIGHSMGGQVAMYLSIHHPEQVKSLTLLAPAGLEQFSESDKQWFKTWITKDYYLSLNDQAVERSFDINFYGNKLPEDARFMLEDRFALKENSTVYSRYIDYVLKAIQGMLEEPVYQDLQKIKVPTLVMFGADDQLIPNRILHKELTVEDVLHISKKIEASKYLLIDEAGHFIQWDRPQEVASQMHEFISKTFSNN